MVFLSISRVISFIAYIFTYFPTRLEKAFSWLHGRIAAKAVLPLEHAFLEWEGTGNKAGLEAIRGIATHLWRAICLMELELGPLLDTRFLPAQDIFPPSMMSPFGLWFWNVLEKYTAMTQPEMLCVVLLTI
eukprot:s369_g31.t1